MYSGKFGIHGMISAIVAFAILGVGALVVDRAHLASAPAGVVRVYQPTLIVALDEIVVSGAR